MTTDDVARFLGSYPPTSQAAADALRRAVRALLPDAQEILDRPAKIVAYGFGPGYANMICTIIPSQKGVKLGIVNGAELPDPKQLLAGAGKRHRHLAFAAASEVKTSVIAPFVKARVRAWKAETGSSSGRAGS